MRVLITGGAGYIGSIATRLFLSKGVKVSVLDNLLFGGEALVDLFKNPNFKFIYGDIRKNTDLESTLKNVDVVINLAALVGEPLCLKYPKLAQETNYQAACAIGDMTKKSGVTKYIFVSTCSNYGINTDNEATEETAVNPLSLYAETKIKAEKYILNLASESFAPIVVRFATVFGISPRMRFDLLVNEFTKQAYLKKKITVYKPEVFRPIIHVDDAAEALLLLAKTSKKINGEIFNIGLGNYQKKEIIKKIAAFIPALKVKLISLASDKRDYRVSFEKAKKKLGFKAKRTLDEGIKETIQALEWNIFPNPNDSRFTFASATLR